MASITTTVTAITEMVHGRMVAVPIESIVSQQTLPAVRTLIEKLSAFASQFNTTTWGGRHSYLPLVLNQEKMRLVTSDESLDCTRIKKPSLIHPNIAIDIKGRDIVQLQEDHKLRWTEYHFQMVIDVVAVEAIVATADEQYIDEIKEDNVRYNNHTIKTMLRQLRTWFVITRSKQVAIKAHFHAPYSDTPNSHITTFARPLDRRQIKCSNHGVSITDNNKVVHFIQEMYVCGLFEARFLDD